MNLTLVLPVMATMLASPPEPDDALPGLAQALSPLRAYGGTSVVAGGPLAALASLAGVDGAAIAPWLALGAGLATTGDARYLLAATPVHLAIAGDDVTVRGRATAISPAYANDAMASINHVFADDGMQFSAAKPDHWFVSQRFAPPMTAVALSDAMHGSIYAHRPTGADGRRWERYGNELQMLLFTLNGGGSTLPVPGMTGVRPPDGVWIWGGGSFPPLPPPVPLAVYTAPGDDSDVATLARGLAHPQRSGGQVLPVDAGALLAAILPPDAAAAVPAHTLVVLPPATGDTLAAHWVAPLVRALEGRRLAQLRVISARTPATCWQAATPTRWQRWRTWLGAPKVTG